MDLLQTETQLKSVLQEAIDRHGSATMLNVVQNVILSQFRIGVKDDQMYLCATFEDEIFVAPMNTVLLDDTHIVEIKQEENTDVEEDYIVENLDAIQNVAKKRKTRGKPAWMAKAEKINARLPWLLNSRLQTVSRAGSRRALTETMAEIDNLTEAITYIGEIMKDFSISREEYMFYKYLLRLHRINLRNSFGETMSRESFMKETIDQGIILDETVYMREMLLGNKIKFVYEELEVSGLLAVEVFQLETLRAAWPALNDFVQFVKKENVIPVIDAAVIDCLLKTIL
ncbi:hypothetical protein HPULCUR_000870 [Helicostylum pulchrum]|uniref:Uncharacterized protein n=1 Tax=Helicostylum pulchrum TaxID=562976 RepID=A0ABP9XL29_9FUNG